MVRGYHVTAQGELALLPQDKRSRRKTGLGEGGEFGQPYVQLVLYLDFPTTEAKTDFFSSGVGEWEVNCTGLLSLHLTDL